MKGREAVYKRYMSLQTPENHAMHIFAWNRTRSILWLVKSSFINRKYANLSSSNSSKDFWHLTKNISNNFTSYFPLLLNPDGTTAVTCISKTEQIVHTFSANFALDDTGHIPHTRPHSDSALPVIRILNNDVFYALSSLDPQKAYGLDGVPPIALQNCASVLTPCLVKLFRLLLSTSTLSSSWKYTYMQPVPKKGYRSNPSNCRSIVLLSFLS